MDCLLAEHFFLNENVTQAGGLCFFICLFIDRFNTGISRLMNT